MDNQQAQSATGDDLINKDIIELLGLSHLPDDQKDKLRQEIASTIESRVFKRVEDILGEKGRLADYEKALEEGDQAVAAVLENEGINIPDLFAQETLVYKAQLSAASDLLSVGISTQVNNRDNNSQEG